MMYFDTPAFLSQSPQLYKQLSVLGGMERVFEIGPAFRAEKHDTYRHLNEFISFDIEGAWMNDDDVMAVQERMIHHIRKMVQKMTKNTSTPSISIERVKARNRLLWMFQVFHSHE